ncbi:hypothetical protein Hanom_Chr08g00711721 [Helianthus anomalus]
MHAHILHTVNMFSMNSIIKHQQNKNEQTSKKTKTNSLKIHQKHSPSHGPRAILLQTIKRKSTTLLIERSLNAEKQPIGLDSV